MRTEWDDRSAQKMLEPEETAGPLYPADLAMAGKDPTIEGIGPTCFRKTIPFLSFLKKF